MQQFKDSFKSVWGLLGFNTGILATVELADIELVLKIVLLMVTIISTILITIHKLKKR